MPHHRVTLLLCSFATFVAGSANYAAIYAGFAVAIIALIWLQVAWLILLLGAQIAFYCQHPEYMKSGRKRLGISARRREALALAVIATVGRAFRDGQPRLREDQLAQALQVPGEALSGVTRDLERSGLLVRSSEGALLPGRELGCVTLYEIIQAVRKAGDDSSRQESLESHPPVEVVVDNVDLAVARSLEGRTARELVDAAPNLGTDPDSGGESRAVN